MVKLFLKSLLSLISTSNALLAWSSKASHVSLVYMELLVSLGSIYTTCKWVIYMRNYCFKILTQQPHLNITFKSLSKCMTLSRKYHLKILVSPVG